MTPRAWFKFAMAAEDAAVAELDIFGSIGTSWWDDTAVSAKQFLDDLAALPKSVTTIRVRVNSPGGDVFDGVAIANALRDQQAKGRIVETTVEGLAASAASVVLMAGSTIKVADNALVMVHHPYTIEMGNAAAMRKMADTLDKITGSIIATYQWHSTLSTEDITALMDAETWMSADEAIANGFATEKVEGLKAAASIDPRAVKALKVPDQYRARVEQLLEKPSEAAQKPQAAAAIDVLRLCREGGVLDVAEGLIAADAPLADVQARISTEKQARAAAHQRAVDIRAACATAKVPELADGYVSGAMTIADVKAHLVTVTALVQKGEIDNGLNPAGARASAPVDITASYARLNGAAKE